MARSVIWSLVTVPLLSLAWTSIAWAGEPCSPTTGCGTGYECKEVLTSCPNVDCRPGADCKLPVECELPEPTYECRPKVRCDVDGDCVPGMLCHAFEAVTCEQGASECAPGFCGTNDPPASVCTTTTYKRCAYRHQLPCKTDTDCGDNFTCREVSECSATSGGAPVPRDGDWEEPAPMDAGASPPDGAARRAPVDGGTSADPICTVVGKQCQAVQKPCSVVAECPSGWSCPVTRCPGDAFCQSYCTPPGREESIDLPKGTIESGDAGTRAPIPRPLPPAVDAGRTASSGSSAVTTGGPYGLPVTGRSVDAAVASGAPAASGAQDVESNSEGGCSVGHPQGGAGALAQLLGLVGALQVLRRRRSSR